MRIIAISAHIVMACVVAWNGIPIVIGFIKYGGVLRLILGGISLMYVSWQIDLILNYIKHPAA